MLKFLVIDDAPPATRRSVRNAYLLGSDHAALRSEITYDGGMLVCQKRESGAAALVLQQTVGDCGELTLPTCLLPEREDPYLLSLEQARHRLMLTFAKLEEWGMFELADDHPVTKRLDRARKLFIEAMCVLDSDMAQADRLAKESLVMGIDASEELALAHADLLLTRRRAVGAIPKSPIGCGVAPDYANDRTRASILANFDFVCLPTPWRLLAPAEDQYRWAMMDSWADWAAKSKMPVLAGPIVSFESSVLPDWVYIWEHDFDTVRDLLYEHTERVVQRYKNVVTTWNAVSGLHINAPFTFSFDQIMELTRMCIMLVKKLQPNARVLVELRQPYGEYFATSVRSIAPLTYADLLIQGAANFDAFALRYLMGQAVPGQYTRDLMQLSNLLDQFSGAGKPLHLTLAVPSEPVTEMMISSPDADTPADADCGYWRKPWSQLVQSRWLEAAMLIAMSKPFVESVAWHEIVDHPNTELPMSGLIAEDLQPKAAFRRMVMFRRSLFKPAAGSPAAPAIPGSPASPGLGVSGAPGVNPAPANPAADPPQFDT